MNLMCIEWIYRNDSSNLSSEMYSPIFSVYRVHPGSFKDAMSTQDSSRMLCPSRILQLCYVHPGFFKKAMSTQDFSRKLCPPSILQGSYIRPGFFKDAMSTQDSSRMLSQHCFLDFLIVCTKHSPLSIRFPPCKMVLWYYINL